MADFTVISKFGNPLVEFKPNTDDALEYMEANGMSGAISFNVNKVDVAGFVGRLENAGYTLSGF